MNKYEYLDARVIMACRNLSRGQHSLSQLVSETGCDENNIRLIEYVVQDEKNLNILDLKTKDIFNTFLNAVDHNMTEVHL